jgi:hypothetical protein
MTSSIDIPAAGLQEYSPDEVIIYGVKLNDLKNGAGKEVPHAVISTGEGLGNMKIKIIAQDSTGKDLGQDKAAIVVAYGYAFQGHCYRLSQPKVFIFETDQLRGGVDPSDPKRTGYGYQAQGCGFDSIPGAYMMWRIRASEQLLELSTTVDTAEKLILEANLPGKRSPNTYESTMQMAHRGGRLYGSRE